MVSIRCKAKIEVPAIPSMAEFFFRLDEWIKIER